MSHLRYQECIDKCYECATLCENCATECLKEPEVRSLLRCIELDRVCAEVCRSAGAIMSQGSQFSEQFCILCAEICEECADECAQHNQMKHCQQCSDVCYSCAQICREMAGIGV